MGLVFWLLPKTPLVVIVCLLLIFLLLVHPIWNFWWIEKKTWRRIAALIAAAAILVWIGVAAWPEQAASTVAVSSPSRLSVLAEGATIVYRRVQGWPWRWILFSGLIGAATAGILTARLLSKRKCRYEWVHQKAIEDRQNIEQLVRIPGIAYKPNFAPDGPYIDFTISIFNNSLYDIAISNIAKGEIWSQSEDSGRPKFHYESKIDSEAPIVCKSRSGNYFTVRQPLRFEEVPRFQDKKNVLFGFGSLELTFTGTSEFPEIESTRLKTDHYVELDKGGWRDWNYPEFAFRFTEEQWALLSLSNKQEVATLEAEVGQLKEQLNGAPLLLEPHYLKAESSLPEVEIKLTVWSEGLSPKVVYDRFGGTMSQYKPIMGFSIEIVSTVENLSLEYNALFQDTETDTEFVSAGTFLSLINEQGENLDLYGFSVRLTGARASDYDIVYTAHVRGTGNLDRNYKNGEFCGTRDRAVEGMKVLIWPKGAKIPYLL